MLALVGCDAARTHSDVATPAQVEAMLPAPVVERLDAEPLRDRAQAAVREQRIHAPAGDNAVEYYLALREREADTGVTAALVELQPYVLIAAEQSLAQDQRDEARRLLDLLARMDPHAPALPRLREGMRVAQERADREEGARIAHVAPSPASVVPSMRASTTGPRPAAPTAVPQVAPAPVATVEPAPPLRPVVPAEAPPSAVGTARAESAPQSLPRLLADAPPRYPQAAQNRRIEGSVLVAFTIQPDGSVSDARPLSAQPAGIFEEAALAAASRWRFEATGRRVATTRTLMFRLPPDSKG